MEVARGFVVTISFRVTPMILRAKARDADDFFDILQPEKTRALAWVPVDRIGGR